MMDDVQFQKSNFAIMLEFPKKMMYLRMEFLMPSLMMIPLFKYQLLTNLTQRHLNARNVLKSCLRNPVY